MNCLVCSEKNCNQSRCKDILESVEDIKQEESVIEEYIKELYP